MALVGGAAAWPLVGRAQQPAMPVVGFMISSIQARSQQIAAFHAGLKDTGYVQGQNVTVELRSAEDHFDRYPALVADLLRHGVAVLVAVSNDGAIAAKRATTTTPIVFGMGGDPVALGLVDSLSHPGSNITGIYFFTQGLEGKRLGLLHELVPTATMIAVLVNTDYSPAKNQLLMCRRRRPAWACKSLCCVPMLKPISTLSSPTSSGNGQARCSSAHLPSSSADGNSLSFSRHAMPCRRSMNGVSLPQPED